MKLEGVFQIEASRDIVWDLVNDPDVLARALPGCESLTRAGENRYEGVINIGIASVKSTYAGVVVLSDIKPGESYAIEVDGEGKGGFVRGRGRIALSDVSGQTSMAVSGDAQVGGRIAGVGQRLLEGAARKLLKDFAAALSKEARRRLEADFRGFRG
jgi:carbon monoxide dehydrogenase subunit G